ncbi:hypothetical protein KKG36_00535 [Patescibacteria group bacterium]|nr:hypothetical protein [Patescibacteria group bacterium]
MNVWLAPKSVRFILDAVTVPEAVAICIRLSSLKSVEVKIFLAQLGDLAKKKSLKILEEFRGAKIQVSESLSKDSLKTQLRTAGKQGIRYVLMFGQREALNSEIVVRDMDSGNQETLKLEEVVGVMKEKLKKLK